MRRRDLTGLIIASAVVTLDGTAGTVALPAVRDSLQLRYSDMQWIGDAPLLALAALLLPAGVIADRMGRTRTVRIGLAGFILASLACAAATSGGALIGLRLLQGAAAALILPGVVATLRAAYRDGAERTRVFGLWAAGTGLASAAGPLLGGGLIDLFSWRAVFVLSAVVSLAGLALLWSAQTDRSAIERRPVPVLSTVALAAAIAAAAYVLIEVPVGGWDRAAIAAASAGLLPLAIVLGAGTRQRLLPLEITTSRNCLAGNAATFGLYFGVFGLSFLLIVYMQQVLGYSGTWSGIGVLPVSVVILLFAEPFGRLTARWGTRRIIATGSIVAATGVIWIATGSDPLPFWSRIMLGSTIFGFGIALAVSALTQVAVGAVPESCAGMASGLNHATVRAAGLMAIALLGSMAAGGATEMSAEGLQRALIACGGTIALVGSTSAFFVDDRAPGGLNARRAVVTGSALHTD